jgi:hypothetical protein
MPYIPGDYKVCCQRCGFDFLRSECVREEKTGLTVCKAKCYDKPHPQDRPMSGKGEAQSVPDPHPEPTDVFLDTSTNGRETL